MNSIRAQHLARKLAAEIQSGKYDSQAHLPSIRALTRRWCASKDTVSSAMDILRKQNLIECDVRQHGFRIAGRLDQARTQQSSRERHHMRIARLLKQEILEGKFRTGSVTSTKELSSRFASSAATIRTALRELTKAGLVSPKGRSYIIAPALHHQKRSSFICFACDPGVFQFAHAVSFVKTLEKVSCANGFEHLHYFLERSPMQGKAPPDESIAAFVYIKMGQTKEWEAFFRSRPTVPLVILDEAERLTWKKEMFGQRRPFYPITFDNRQAGQQIGTSLLLRGHRKIAFISHVRIEKGWSTKRLQGIQDIFSVSGSDVVVCTPGSFQQMANTPYALRFSALAKELRRDRAVPHPMVEDRIEPLYGLAASANTAQQMDPVFEEALATGATAWVCINDELAALAYHFIAKRDMRVSRDISIIGFDNSVLSLRMSLTTYDFCYDRAASIALRCLLTPASVLRDETGHIRVNGELIERTSVGKPK